MLQHEFEARTGLSVSDEYYNLIDTIYMSCPDFIDKDTFCRNWMTRRGCIDLLEALTKIHLQTVNAYNALKSRSSQMQDEQSLLVADFVEYLLRKSEIYGDTDMRQEAVRLIGEADVIRTKLRLSLSLTDSDLDYISRNLQ